MPSGPSDPSASDAFWIADILGTAALVETFVRDSSPSAFLTDAKTSFAVRYALLSISEATRRLSSDLKARHPDIPWRGIADLGNVYRHEYHRVSDAVVWRTATDALRPLVEAMRSERSRSRADPADP
jgi:uncharacterized protein with HEPN domain